MPCPYFEPQRAVAREQTAGRLPLIDEYEGLCRAGVEAFTASDEVRRRYCNHGNSRGACGRFPEGEVRSALRYHIMSSSATELRVLLMEERDYAPYAWQPITYVRAGGRLEPETNDSCQQAQVRAFCESYLARFEKT